MSLFLGNRDNGGSTDEQGHFRFILNSLTGNVARGFELSSSGLSLTISQGVIKIDYNDYGFISFIDEDYTLTLTDTTGVNAIVVYIDRDKITPGNNNPNSLTFEQVNATTPDEVATALGDVPYLILAFIELDNSGEVVRIFDEAKKIMSLTAVDDVYPVGSIYINSQNLENPANLLGVGEWEQIKSQSFIGYDPNIQMFKQINITVGGNTHSLRTSELPAHSHNATTSVNGEHNHSYFGPIGMARLDIYHSTIDRPRLINTSHVGRNTHVSGNHSHRFTTSTRGTGTQHNNIQPTRVVSIWRRTA